MAVPKKRTGASAQGHRRSNWKATKPETTTCSKCNAVVLTHTVCTECGYYKGKPASIKHEDYKVEELAPKKKPAKKAKTTKAKAEKAEAKAEETVVEETKVAEAETKEVKAEETEKEAE